MYCGFDIGGTKLLAVAVDGSDLATPVATRRTETDGEALIDTLISVVSDLESQCTTTFDAVGVAIAGLVDHAGVLRYSPHIDAAVDIDVGSQLRLSLRRPVIVDNDANAAIWAETHHGAARGFRHVVGLTLGTGVGSGLVMDGRLYRGAGGFAGESGHMIIDQSGPIHITGMRGPLEYFASGLGLARLARRAATKGHFDAAIEAAGSVDAIRGEHVGALLRTGDPEALALLDKLCTHAAIGAANLISILDPEIVVVGGGLVDIGPPLLDGISRQIDRFVFGSEHRPSVPVVAAEMGDKAGAIGAAILAWGTATGASP